MRETSVEAYEKIKASGLLSKRRWQVYDILFRCGPLTARQIAEDFGVPGGWKRCSELQEMGLIREVGTRVDSKTQQTVLVWDVTVADTPRQLPQRQSVGRCPLDGSKLVRAAFDPEGWVCSENHILLIV